MFTSTSLPTRAAVASSAAALLLLACSGKSSEGAAAPKPVVATAASTTFWKPDSGERHLRNIRQLTFGGNNAESYFSRDSKQLIFQRQEQVDAGCDQQYLINADGSNMRRVSNGEGRTTCGFFYDGDKRILYSSTSSTTRPAPFRRTSPRAMSGRSAISRSTPRSSMAPTCAS